MNKWLRRLVAHRWFTPLSFGASYWLLDTLYTLTVPAAGVVTVYNAFFPASIEGWIFRILMFCVCAGVGLALERLNRSLIRTKKLLFLTDYAIEHTKAFALFWFDEKGRVIRVNQQAAERLGYSKKELLKMDVFSIDAQATPESWAAAWERLKKEQNLTIRTQHRRKDGTTLSVVEHFQYLKIDGAQYDFAFVCDATACPLGLCRVFQEPAATVKVQVPDWGRLNNSQDGNPACAACNT